METYECLCGNYYNELECETHILLNCPDCGDRQCISYNQQDTIESLQAMLKRDRESIDNYRRDNATMEDKIARLSMQLSTKYEQEQQRLQTKLVAKLQKDLKEAKRELARNRKQHKKEVEEMKKQLKNLRREAGFASAKAFAEDTGLSLSLVQKIEEGVREERPWIRKYMLLLIDANASSERERSDD